MEELKNFMKTYPNLNVTIGLTALLEFGRFLIDETTLQIEQKIADEKAELYYSPKKTAEILDVNPSTLWRWNRSNYLNHIELGGKRRYRMSDVKRILEGGKSK